MKKIVLDGIWRYLPAQHATQPIPFNETDGEPYLSANVGSGALWLAQQFEMPVNDTCSVWWFELEKPLNGKLWINGQEVGNLHQRRLPITDVVAVGENQVVLWLEALLDGDMLHTLACVAYPCDECE